MSRRTAEILDGHEVVICAGSGGVGKTTTSAAIAAGMAARGKKVVVLTIDPAKRLADSLGLSELGNEAARVDPELFAAEGIDTGGGELWAMMLDAKATFDELIAKNAPDEESRERILNNQIYRQLSNALAGSQEYMAMEKLYELHASGEYDLLVLDTPPTRNALDFLDAPKRLMQFIEGRSLQAFMAPTGLAAKVVGRGTGMVFSILKRVTGLDLLSDLSEFFQAFSGMVDGFQERATHVNELLCHDRTTFLIVCGPQGEPIKEASYFLEKLRENEMRLGGVVVNKVHTQGDSPAEIDTNGLAKALGPGLAERVEQNFGDYHALAERDRRNISELTEQLRSETVIEVPYLDDDVHDLAGLLNMDRWLF